MPQGANTIGEAEGRRGDKTPRWPIVAQGGLGEYRQGRAQREVIVYWIVMTNKSSELTRLD